MTGQPGKGPRRGILDKVFPKMRSGIASKREAETYTDALIRQIPDTLTRYRDNVESALRRFDLGEWTGETADNAVTEALERAKAGKTWQSDFFNDLEEEAVRLNREAEALASEARIGLPGQPGVDEKREAYHAARQKAQAAYNWFFFLSDTPKTVADTTLKLQRTNTTFRRVVTQALKEYVAPLMAFPDYHKRFFEALEQWERGEQRLERPCKKERAPEHLDRKALSLVPIDADGLTQMFGNKGTHGLNQARFGANPEERRTENGSYQVTKGKAGDVAICKRQTLGDKAFCGLGQKSKDLLTLSQARLCEMNTQGIFNSQTAKRFVDIPLRPYMESFGLTNVKESRILLQDAGNELLSITIFPNDTIIRDTVGKNGRHYKKRADLPTPGFNVLGSAGFIDPNTFRLEFSSAFVEYLVCSNIERFPIIKAAAISTKDRLAHELMECFFERWNCSKNKRAYAGQDPNKVVISVGSILKKCPSLPLENELTLGQRKNLTRTYGKRIVAALDTLVKEEVISDWMAKHPRGVDLSVAERDSLTRWSLLKTLYIHVTIPADHQKQYLLENTMKRKEREAAKAKSKQSKKN